MKLFEELIKPKSVEVFFEKHWTRKELHLSGCFNSSALFSMAKLNDIIKTNQDHLLFPVIRLVKNGKIISESKYTELVEKRRQETSKRIVIEKLVEYCTNGATLTINGLNNYSSALSDYSNELSSEFNEATQINCYLTQKENQGFEAHFDHHEIFIIQIEGEKEWELFGVANAFPLTRKNHYEQGEPDYKNKRSYNLVEGDVLYIPRGMWHQAKSIKTSSLHLTINIMCSLNLDFIHWIFDQVAINNKEFRKNLYHTTALDKRNPMELAIEYLQRMEKNYLSLLKKFNQTKIQSKDFKLPFNK